MDPKYLIAEQLGIRLESIGGLHIWEAQPVWKHQKAVDRIRASIRPGSESHADTSIACECVHAADVYVQFKDGSLKRPDVSIFCREPSEQEDAITLLPEAVIEVVSKGYEAKDLEIGPRFYLQQGVKDIVVYDPATQRIVHTRRDGVHEYTSPKELRFECGCVCVV
jgi:Putative restriction endonuclease